MTVLTEGKTKRICSTDKPNEVLIETKDDLTGGDAAKLETISGISVHKTNQACNVFELLASKGIETAFIRRAEPNSFVCHACDMLPLELVMRRYAWGSFLKREPTLVSTPENPHRFQEIRSEFYHKHAVVVPPLVDETLQMEEGLARRKYLRDGVWKEGVFTDPLIRINAERWFLHYSKAPVDPTQPLLEIDPLLSPSDTEALLSELMLPVFQTLEKAWANIETSDGPVALVDMKIECGRRRSDGKLVVADVIDNDSWRIWPGSDPRKQLDKQCFREGHPLSEVAENYEVVSRLSDQFNT